MPPKTRNQGARARANLARNRRIPRGTNAGYATPGHVPIGFGEPGYRPPSKQVTKPNYGPMPPAGTGQSVLDSIAGISGALAAPAPSSGPYQGAAGSETQHPGQPRVPSADWANASSPNYERRNYYVHNGETIAREPGYYNPDNPWDTGRAGEGNKEFGAWDPSAERRMSEPGVTPWGPGGKASAPGAFPGPGGGGGGGAQHPSIPPDIFSALGGQNPPSLGDFGQGSQQIPDELLAFLHALMGKIPTSPRSGSAI